MSATFTQMAVMAIFSAAIFAFVVFWTLTIVFAIKRLRAGNVSGNRSAAQSEPQEACDVVDTATEDGIHYSPIS